MAHSSAVLIHNACNITSGSETAEICLTVYHWGTHPVFESDENAQERRSRSSFIQRERCSRFLSIHRTQSVNCNFHGCPLIIKLTGFLRSCTCVWYMCLCVWYHIWDNWPIGTRNCFSTCFNFYTPYTNIKTSAKNAAKWTIARYRGGDTPSLDSTSSALSAPRFSRLRRSAFPFLFTYDSNTRRICTPTHGHACGTAYVSASSRTTQYKGRSV